MRLLVLALIFTVTLMGAVAFFEADKGGAQAPSAPASCEEAATAGTPCLLPNLLTMAWGNHAGDPWVVVIRTRVKRTIKRYLAFDNQVANVVDSEGSLVGDTLGPLELVTVSEDCDGDGNVRNDRTAYQRLYLDTGDPGFNRAQDTGFISRPVGCMVFHIRHHHWHFDGFAGYQLFGWSGSARTDDPIGTSDKVSFCIIDVEQVDPAAGSAYFTQCRRSSVEGLSPGWSDIYGYGLAGQSIEIPAGDASFCLVSTADPLHWLDEVNDEDNTTARVLTLVGDTVTVSATSC